MWEEGKLSTGMPTTISISFAVSTPAPLHLLRIRPLHPSTLRNTVHRLPRPSLPRQLRRLHLRCPRLRTTGGLQALRSLLPTTDTRAILHRRIADGTRALLFLPTIGLRAVLPPPYRLTTCIQVSRAFPPLPTTGTLAILRHHRAMAGPCGPIESRQIPTHFRPHVSTKRGRFYIG